MTEQTQAPLDEHYDTQMEVERNPAGAWMAIQKQAAEIEDLKHQLILSSQPLFSRRKLEADVVTLKNERTFLRGLVVKLLWSLPHKTRGEFLHYMKDSGPRGGKG